MNLMCLWLVIKNMQKYLNERKCAKFRHWNILLRIYTLINKFINWELEINMETLPNFYKTLSN